MFSLRTLAAQVAPPREKVAPCRDDSGLIDLAALAAMQEERAERPKLEVAPFAGVGLFETPEKAPEPVPPPPAQVPSRTSGRRTLAMVAGAAVAVAAVSAAIILTMRATGDARLPPVAELPAVTAPASPPSEPPRTEAPAPTEAKTVETAPTTKPPPAPTASAPRRGPKPLASATVKPEPAKPAPACDLLCQMKKAVPGSR